MPLECDKVAARSSDNRRRCAKVKQNGHFKPKMLDFRATAAIIAAAGRFYHINSLSKVEGGPVDQPLRRQAHQRLAPAAVDEGISKQTPPDVAQQALDAIGVCP